MNARELAKELDNRVYENGFDNIFFESVNVLRQQADRIAELEKIIQAFRVGRGGKSNLFYTKPQTSAEPDCYGDGNVYRGVRSKDSEIKTIDYTTPQTSAEPVAWLFKHKKVVDFIKPRKGDDNWFPLYTTPQTKPRLSDEEVKDLYMEMFGSHINLRMLAFTRAIEERILRK